MIVSSNPLAESGVLVMSSADVFLIAVMGIALGSDGGPQKTCSKLYDFVIFQGKVEVIYQIVLLLQDLGSYRTHIALLCKYS
jgi:hypothetical protein